MSDSEALALVEREARKQRERADLAERKLAAALSTPAEVVVEAMHAAWCAGMRMKGAHGPRDHCKMVGRTAYGSFPCGTVLASLGGTLVACPRYNASLVDWKEVEPAEQAKQLPVAEAAIAAIKGRADAAV